MKGHNGPRSRLSWRPESRPPGRAARSGNGAGGLPGATAGHDRTTRSPPKRAGGRRKTLGAALALLVAASLTLGSIEVAVLLNGPADVATGTVAFALTGLGFVLIGVVVWDRRATNGTGPLLCLTGVLCMVADSANLGYLGLAIAGGLLAQTPVGALLHLVVAFPSGRLRTPLTRRLVAAGYLVTVGFVVPQYFFGAASAGTVAHITGQASVAGVTTDAENVCGVIILALTASALWSGVRRSARTSSERRVLSGVNAYGLAVLVYLSASSSLLPLLFHVSAYEVFEVQVAVLATVPCVFAAAVLAGGFARSGALEDLGAWLGAGDSDRMGLRDALAETVGDPTLQLVFADSDGAPPDLGGRPFDPGKVTVPRAVSTVDGPAGPVGYLIYDPALVDDAAVVDGAARVVALAVERDRLTADLLAERAAVRESSARLVAASDRERRRVARDLHDLVQGPLILAALHAGQLTAGLSDADRAQRIAVALRKDLDATITALRGQLQNLMPALLLERGLAAAVVDLADRLPIPAEVRFSDGLDCLLAPEVATSSYSIVAEALTNVIRHASATSVEIEITRTNGRLRIAVSDNGRGGATATGEGLRGMADRVKALGGLIQIISPPGGGTHIGVSLPCG